MRALHAQSFARACRSLLCTRHSACSRLSCDCTLPPDAVPRPSKNDGVTTSEAPKKKAKSSDEHAFAVDTSSDAGFGAGTKRPAMEDGAEDESAGKKQKRVQGDEQEAEKGGEEESEEQDAMLEEEVEATADRADGAETLNEHADSGDVDDALAANVPDIVEPEALMMDEGADDVAMDQPLAEQQQQEDAGGQDEGAEAEDDAMTAPMTAPMTAAAATVSITDSDQ